MSYAESNTSLTAIERAVLSALAIDDDRKGALTVRAILVGKNDEQVFAHLSARGRRTTLKAIRWYRSGLNRLERDQLVDGRLHWLRHAPQTNIATSEAY